MFFRYSLLAIFWAGVILLLSLTPGKYMPKVSLFSFDKLAHAFVYMVLVFFTIYGFKRQYTYPKLRSYAVKAAILFGTIYGGLLELGQFLIIGGDRQGDLFDFFANFIGCLLGSWLYNMIFKK